MMERKPVIRDAQLQAFIDKANRTETISIIIQIKPLPSAVPPQRRDSELTEAIDMLPGPASAEAVAASVKNCEVGRAQAKLRQQKLRLFLDRVLKKLGLTERVTCNALAGTVALDVTANQLKELTQEPSVEAIVENKRRL